MCYYNSRKEKTMNITDVKIRNVNGEGKMKAVVSFTIDNTFVVHDVKIIEGQKGLFLAMPSRKIGDTEFRDICHPINSEARNYLQDVIFAAYAKHKEEQANATPEVVTEE